MARVLAALDFLGDVDKPLVGARLNADLLPLNPFPQQLPFNVSRDRRNVPGAKAHEVLS